MINLTVAVMSDTFERVMTTVNLTIGKDRNSLILNYENFLFWRRCPRCCRCIKKQNEFYLYFVRYTDNDKSHNASALDTIIDSIEGP